uniref:cytochrome P450 2U1 n=1 Tax=Ciona intestinalis TaxID=7719 RepID=UPI00006A5168|nr:cytochrome P450 2U1 [Ciona intestinalis]|eukprot:XP_009858562.1 cytochrome P450 2U1 [Ciona intestinalis]
MLTNLIANPSISPVLAILSCVIAFYYWYKRPKNMPPGPRGIPFLGIIPFVGMNPEQAFMQWSKKYGPVITVRMGRKDWVVLCDHDTIHQVLVKQSTVCSGRPKIPIVSELSKGHGILFADYCEKWKSQRKFGMKTLREFGVGKKCTEDRVLEEVDFLCNEIRSKNGKPFDIQDIMCNAVSNIIMNIVIGRRCNYDETFFTDVISRFTKWFNDPTAGAMFTGMMFLPQLKYVPPFSKYYKIFRDDIGALHEVFEEVIKEHEKNFDGNNLRDFIDAFLLEMKKNESGSEFTYIQLLNYIRDLFDGGTETTVSTSRWAILCMLHYPETQKKLRNEIMTIIGPNTPASMSHKSDMPYTCAFIQEVLRFRTLVPLSVPHKVNEDATVNGYTIPKGVTVSPNLWAVHNDPDVWDEPSKFKPERHLDDKGNFVQSNHVIPFSVGPRHCLGEQLARMEIFIFLISMIQKFEFLPDPNEPDLPEINHGTNGAAFVPLPYKIVANQI